MEDQKQDHQTREGVKRQDGRKCYSLSDKIWAKAKSHVTISPSGFAISLGFPTVTPGCSWIRGTFVSKGIGKGTVLDERTRLIAGGMGPDISRKTVNHHHHHHHVHSSRSNRNG